MKVLKLIITVAILWIVYYFVNPTMNTDMVSFWVTLIITVTLLLAIWVQEIGVKSFVVPALLLVVLGFRGCASSEFINDTQYRNLINADAIKESDFTKDVAPISTKDIRIVDPGVADKIGDKKLGDDAALGSVAEVNNFTLQEVGGRMYYVAPLAHKSFFRWKEIGYTTGYIMVSATSLSDVRLIQKVGDKDIKIRYQPSAWFGDNLRRHIWMNGYKSTPLTDYSFEIDDDMNPWWVVTTYENTIGLYGSDATGVLLVNPENGEIVEYSIEDAPGWIDRIQPREFVMDQLADWGEYINGWWNPSDVDELRTSEGSQIVEGVDGNLYYYTGITSSGSDESTTAFMMVNTRTKETFRYNKSGATEAAAQRVAEAKVANLGYKALFPVTYNVGGVETYFMSLVGDDYIPHKYAMVSVKNYNIVGVGDDVRSTLRDYEKALYSKGNQLSIAEGAERFKVSSTIVRFQPDIIDGQTTYYMMIKEFPQKVFVGTSDLSPELPLSKIGEKVTITYDESKQELIRMQSFDNDVIVLQKTNNQLEREKYFNKLDTVRYKKREVKNAKQQLKELSDEEQLELYNKIKNKQ